MKLGIFFDHMREAAEQTKLPLEAICQQAHAAGIDYVEITGSFLMENERRVEELLHKTGLSVGCVDEVLDLAHGKDADKAEALIRYAAKKGIAQVLLIPGFVEEGEERDAVRERIAEGLRPLAHIARGLHVTCSLEDFDGAAATFGTWQELQWFMQQVEGLSCTLDTGNFAFFGQDVREGLPALAPYICQVHCKDRAFIGREGEKPLVAVDGRKLYPASVGGGEMPIAEVLETLTANGFDGMLTIEHYDCKNQLSDLLASAQYLSRLIKKED